MFKTICLGLILIFSMLPGSAAGQNQAPAKELIQYIRDAQKAGLNGQQIQQNALTAGWPAAAVKDAMDSLMPAAKTGTPPAAPGNEPVPPKSQPAGSQPQPVNKPEAATFEQPSAAPALQRATGDRPAGVPAAAPPTSQEAAPPTHQEGKEDEAATAADSTSILISSQLYGNSLPQSRHVTYAPSRMDGRFGVSGKVVRRCEHPNKLSSTDLSIKWHPQFVDVCPVVSVAF
jgi:hypothetical protein